MYFSLSLVKQNKTTITTRNNQKQKAELIELDHSLKCFFHHHHRGSLDSVLFYSLFSKGVRFQTSAQRLEKNDMLGKGIILYFWSQVHMLWILWCCECWNKSEKPWGNSHFWWAMTLLRCSWTSKVLGNLTGLQNTLIPPLSIPIKQHLSRRKLPLEQTNHCVLQC